MEFEGLTIETPADVAEALRSGRSTRPQDEFAWAWVLRFIKRRPDARELVEEAVALLVSEEGGEALEPTPLLLGVMTLAEIAGLRSHLPALRRQLDRGFDDAAPAVRVNRFLQWLLGARPDRAAEPLTDAEIERVAELGRRPGCFAPAIRIVCRSAPWRVAECLVEAGRPAWEGGEEFVERLALQWRKRIFAPYRLELLSAAAASSPELLAELCAHIEAAPGGGVSELLELAREPADHATTAACTQMVARIFFEGGPAVRRALLVHPRDEQGLELDAGRGGDDDATFAAYAAEVQAGADELVRGLGPPRAVARVDDPKLLDGEGEPLASLLVPVSFKAARRQEVTIFRLRDRFKVAPAVRADP